METKMSAVQAVLDDKAIILELLKPAPVIELSTEVYFLEYDLPYFQFIHKLTDREVERHYILAGVAEVVLHTMGIMNTRTPKGGGDVCACRLVCSAVDPPPSRDQRKDESPESAQRGDGTGSPRITGLLLSIVSLKPRARGCHLITAELVNAVRTDLAAVKIGLAQFFIQHTSASLTINENADPDVRTDMGSFVSFLQKSIA
ncbi:hypothetical protein BC828DRAFT_417756 [Blastocladiella britannica]|nr:hypothetical protein BC828DRAFT_417756 [Blastocladiella britannica]